MRKTQQVADADEQLAERRLSMSERLTYTVLEAAKAIGASRGLAYELVSTGAGGVRLHHGSS